MPIELDVGHVLLLVHEEQPRSEERIIELAKQAIWKAGKSGAEKIPDAIHKHLLTLVNIRYVKLRGGSYLLSRRGADNQKELLKRIEEEAQESKLQK